MSVNRSVSTLQERFPNPDSESKKYLGALDQIQQGNLRTNEFDKASIERDRRYSLGRGEGNPQSGIGQVRGQIASAFNPTRSTFPTDIPGFSRNGPQYNIKYPAGGRLRKKKNTKRRYKQKGGYKKKGSMKHRRTQRRH